MLCLEKEEMNSEKTSGELKTTLNRNSFLIKLSNIFDFLLEEKIKINSERIYIKKKLFFILIVMQFKIDSCIPSKYICTSLCTIR